MNQYSIEVSGGKVIGDSVFFRTADTQLAEECNRICAFTDMLDADPAQKKERIAEYKCAKYRYAAVSLIHSTVINNNRCRKLHNLESTHHLLLPFDEIFKTQAEALALYETAEANEKPDYSLYYAMTAFADGELAELEGKIPYATDWEKVELEERIGGLQFAKQCLDQAWLHRKE